MQPRSHRFIIEAALGLARADAWIHPHARELLAGSDDEDVYEVPFTKLRLPALGLTHTYRPGKRTGELGAPSARTHLLYFVRRSEHELGRSDAPRAAWWLGRACHLLVDMAVPARTRGVWHLLGDPLESWVEQAVLANDDRLVASERAPAGNIGALADELAALSSSFPADTTRGPLGLLRHKLLGRSIRIDAAEAEA
ncbi:MAG: hypothetical protein JWM74_4217, partial [Myxococcaceae bacterium]|nr:hypothetical protein [Myxococcaceae bacterium]